MKRMYGFLQRSFACLAVTLVILGALAMPSQGVKANDPSSGGSGTDNPCYCNTPDPDDCPNWNCVPDFDPACSGRACGYPCCN